MPARERLKRLKHKNNKKFRQQAYKVDAQCWQSRKCMLGFGPIVGGFFVLVGAVLVSGAKDMAVARSVYACCCRTRRR